MKIKIENKDNTYKNRHAPKHVEKTKHKKRKEMPNKWLSPKEISEMLKRD